MMDRHDRYDIFFQYGMLLFAENRKRLVIESEQIKFIQLTLHFDAACWKPTQLEWFANWFHRHLSGKSHKATTFTTEDHKEVVTVATKDLSSSRETTTILFNK